MPSIADALRSGGVQFADERVAPRSGSFIVEGLMWHHTASNKNSGDHPSLGIIKRGRSDLPGPLSQILIGRSGSVFLTCDWGRANHAGNGCARVLDDVRNRRPVKGARAYGCSDSVGGNGLFIGIECENNGVGEPWPAAQYASMVRVGIALCSGFGRDPMTQQIEHLEWTRRKIDRANLDANKFRADVAAGSGQPPSPGGFLMALTDKQQEDLYEMMKLQMGKMTGVQSSQGQTPGSLIPLNELLDAKLQPVFERLDALEAYDTDGNPFNNVKKHVDRRVCGGDCS